MRFAVNEDVVRSIRTRGAKFFKDLNMSKGSSPRPYSVSQKQFANNFDAIFRKPDPRTVEDQKIEDEEFERIAQSNQVKDSEQGG